MMLFFHLLNMDEGKYWQIGILAVQTFLRGKAGYRNNLD